MAQVRRWRASPRQGGTCPTVPYRPATWRTGGQNIAAGFFFQRIWSEHVQVIENVRVLPEIVLLRVGARARTR